jgi:RNA polymerase subunit RPABC4/transcription elongation factor Spt4
MDIGAIFIGLALLVLTVPVVVKPFRQNQSKGTGPGHHKGQPSLNGHDLKPQREQVLAALRDLDFDYQTGKIAEQDYTILRSELMVQAAQLIRSQETEDEAIENLIRARREALSVGEARKCSQCGRKLSADDRFCPGCGEPVGTACPKCGQTTTSEDRFCSKCGEPVAVKSEAKE